MSISMMLESYKPTGGTCDWVSAALPQRIIPLAGAILGMPSPPFGVSSILEFSFQVAPSSHLSALQGPAGLVGITGRIKVSFSTVDILLFNDVVSSTLFEKVTLFVLMVAKPTMPIQGINKLRIVLNVKCFIRLGFVQDVGGRGYSSSG